MELLVSLLTTVFFGFLASFLIYDCAENNFSKCKALIQKARCIFVPYSVYKISEIKWVSGYDGGHYSVIIDEEGVKIPVDCPAQIAATLEEIIKFNNKDVSISIKAKINRKNLKLVSAKGYMIKQQ